MQVKNIFNLNFLIVLATLNRKAQLEKKILDKRVVKMTFVAYLEF